MLDRLKRWLRGGDRQARYEFPGTAASAGPAATAATLSAAPDDAELNYRAGLAHLEQGDAASALDYFHLALHYKSDLFAACAARARALAALQRPAEEAGAYREFLHANPGHPGAGYALALWHHARGEHESAIELLRPLAEARPPNRDACNLLGLILGREFGHYAEGERLLRLALELDPLWPVALCNLGWILLEKGDYAPGLKLLDTVLARHPDDHEVRLVRSYMNLKHAEFSQGWRDYDARLHSRFAAQRQVHYPKWDGTPIPGKTLLVYGEQGFGDQIMFASCLGDAMALAGRCIIECDPRLVALFRRAFPAATIEASAPAKAPSAALARAHAIDREIPMGDLPGLFRNSWEEFPRHSGYLRAEPERIAYWRDRLEALGPGPKIGLSWRGGVAATRRHLRSFELKELLPVLRQPAAFVSLQYGDCAGDLVRLREEQGLILSHWPDALDDYAETAALVCALDLVISVCTSVIHLAGALGKPVWILVPAVAEWRYLAQGEEMPWYPSARLFRQADTEAWRDVIDRVAAELTRMRATDAKALW